MVIYLLTWLEHGKWKPKLKMYEPYWTWGIFMNVLLPAMLVYRRNKPHKASASQKNHLIGVPAVFATFSGDLHERSCSQDFWLTNSSSTKQLHYRFVFWSLSLHKSSIQNSTISSRTACLKIEFIEHRFFLEDFIPKGGTCYNTGILTYSYIKHHKTTHQPNRSPTHPTVWPKCSLLHPLSFPHILVIHQRHLLPSEGVLLYRPSPRRWHRSRHPVARDHRGTDP